MKCRLCGENLESKEISASLEGQDVILSGRSQKSCPIITCYKCGLVQISGLLSPLEITALYENLEDKEFVASSDSRIASIKLDLAKIAPHLPESPSFLELGAFTGNGATAIRQTFPKSAYLGIEVSRWAAKEAQKKGLPVIEGGVGTPIPSMQFNAVLAWDVLEHLEDPNSFFAWINDRLPEDALIFLNVPNWDSIWRKLLGKNWWFRVPMHRSYFNRSSLRKLADRNGWQIVDSWPHRKFRTFGYIWARLMNYRREYLYKPDERFSKLSRINILLRLGQVAVVLKRTGQ